MSTVRPLFLVGFMGAGKSTVGPLLADRLGRPFVDLDDVVEAQTGRTVAQLFDEVGEDGFRDAEREALSAVAKAPAAIVACGGGIVVNAESRALLSASGDVVYLTVSADEALSRVEGQLENRPLLQGADPAGAASLLGLRERLYGQVADLTVGTAGHTPAEIAERIAEWTELES